MLKKRLFKKVLFQNVDKQQTFPHTKSKYTPKRKLKFILDNLCYKSIFPITAVDVGISI